MTESAPTALLVEDERQIRRFVRMALETEGWHVSEAETLKQGLIDAGTRKPDVVILDLGLPDDEGVSLCRALRARGVKTPILVLTARSEVSKRVEALDAGADDFMGKPFAVAELRARVRALGRRASSTPAAPLAHDNMMLDVAARRASRGDSEVKLTTRE